MTHEIAETDIARSELMFTTEWAAKHPLLAATKLGTFIMKNRALGFEISFDDSDYRRRTCIATMPAGKCKCGK